MTNEEHLARYAMVVDGELYDGKRVKYISKEKIVAERVKEETRMFFNELAAARTKVFAAPDENCLASWVNASGAGSLANLVAGPAQYA
jgi:hypothetical protein